MLKKKISSNAAIMRVFCNEKKVEIIPRIEKNSHWENQDDLRTEQK